MENKFNVGKSSLEASVKAYHRKVIEPILPLISGDSDEFVDLMEKLITKDNIGEQSVKYADSAGSVDWSNIKNIPGDSGDHTHSNKEILDNISGEDVEVLIALKEEYIQWKENYPDSDPSTFITQLCNPNYWGTF